MPVQPFTFNKRQGPGTANASLAAGSSIASDTENGSIVSGGPSQQTMGGVRTPQLESGFPDPYRLLAESRRVLIAKELTQQAKLINCVFGFCGVTRFRYFVRDAVTGRDLFKAKLSYSSSCNVCAGGTRHNYTLELFLLPQDGSTVLGKDQAKRGLFLSTSTSDKSAIATGGHGVMDMRNMETVGRIIPSPSGAITVKEGTGGVAFRIAVPINTGYGGSSSEMLIEDGATTALVGRLTKQWGKGDNDLNIICCCGNGRDHGAFTLDISAVSNVKKRGLLVMAAIIADAVAFDFRAAAPMSPIRDVDEDSPVKSKIDEKKPLLSPGGTN